MKTITVKLSKWRCGGVGGHSLGKGLTFLLNEDGYCCCLGFGCRQHGPKNLHLKDKTTPANTRALIEGLTTDIVPTEFAVGLGDGFINSENIQIYNTWFSYHAVELNDDPKLTLTERMEQLITLGLECGFDFQFVI